MSKAPKQYKPRYKTVEPKAFPVEQKPGETLNQWYKRLGKSVDRRLERLKEASKKPFYENATNYAYEYAMNELHRINGDAAKRFETLPPLNARKREQMMEVMKTFLTMQTSTPGGITAMYKKRANTVNDRYGTNFTWQEINTYFDTAQNEKWAKKFGSKTALKVIGRIQRYSKEAARQFGIDVTKVNRTHIRAVMNEGDGSLVDDLVSKALKDTHLNMKDLVK